MRAWLILGLLGCGSNGTGPGADDTGGDPQGTVTIDGEGSVAVKDSGGAALPGSPFSCTGGNCGGTPVTTTTRMISFTATPGGTSTFGNATIESGGGSQTPVTANTPIAVDPAAGWILQVVFN